MNSELFKRGRDWQYNAIITHPNPLNKWLPYADGYKLAAESLCELLLEKPSSIDLYIYPIIFLYRHHIELRLKEIIFHAGILVDDEPTFPKHHDIKRSWEQVSKIILNIWPNEDDKHLDHLGEMIIELHDIDQKSDAFRYPVDIKNHPNLVDVDCISLKIFMEKIKPVTDHLEGMILSIRQTILIKNEMSREFEQYKDAIETGVASYYC